MLSFIDLSKHLHLPILASEHGKDVDKLIIYVHWLMLLLFVGWTAYFIYVMFRFRQSRQPRADHVGVKSHFSTYVEVGVALVEAILLIGFAVPLWAKVADEFPDEKQSTVIRVTAQQFLWNSRYPGKDGKFGKQNDRIVSSDNPLGLVKDDPDGKDDLIPAINVITVPVKKPVIIHLTSMDVIHSFKVLPLRVTQDAIPGMSIPVHFVPTLEGRYLVNCAQLCGNSHYSMKGFLNVVSQEQFDKWEADLVKSSTGAPGAASGFE